MNFADFEYLINSSCFGIGAWPHFKQTVCQCSRFKKSVYQKWKSQHQRIKSSFSSSSFSNFRKIIFLSNCSALWYLSTTVYILLWSEYYSLRNLWKCFHCQLIWDKYSIHSFNGTKLSMMTWNHFCGSISLSEWIIKY